MADQPFPDISAAQMDAALAFLPVFEKPGYSFGEWETPEGQFPYYTYSAEVERFVRALSSQGFIIKFDWPNWQATAKAYMDDPATLAGADLLTLRKLLTTYIRSDRFVEGHLAGMLEDGHITAILRRLQAIRQSLPQS